MGMVWLFFIKIWLIIFLFEFRNVLDGFIMLILKFIWLLFGIIIFFVVIILDFDGKEMVFEVMILK